MTNKELSFRTKQTLAEALKRAMVKKTLSKITVSELITDCNINRKTFYYHFQDIYALLKWTLEQEAIEVVKNFDLTVNTEEAFSFVMNYVEENAYIISGAFDSMGYEEIKLFFYNDLFSVTYNAIAQGEKNLKVSVDSQFKNFLAAFYTEATAGLIIEWAKNRITQDKETVLYNLLMIYKVSIPAVLIAEGKKINTEIPLRKPLFITLAGLPGTGKTTLAKSLAKKLSLVYLRLDCIEVPFYRYNAASGSKGEGYDAIVNLARENLNLGLDVIVDTVNPLHLTRKLFRDLAKESNANLLQFELKTNNLLLHKKRIEQRKADIIGHNLPTWNKVLNVEYEEWDESVDGLATVIFTDNGKKAFSECLDTIRNHLD